MPGPDAPFRPLGQVAGAADLLERNGLNHDSADGPAIGAGG
jgi:hypothetical protein